MVGVVLLSGCQAASSNAVQSRPFDPSRFTYTRIYGTPDTETHFETLTVQLTNVGGAPPAPPFYGGFNRPASSMRVAGFDPHWGTRDLETRLNHPAPAAQFVAILEGGLSITTTDGETRRFRVGDVIRVEDTSPCKGHISVVGDKPMFVIIAR